ncbi:MAG: phosphoenolpyruvate synthase [Candidatus Delongbacteria bacterium]|jgi:CheY-like chemotaxis protein|nr:phosphoenolpyruvate synthase [Candidatus Delongbacteria bacterium]
MTDINLLKEQSILYKQQFREEPFSELMQNRIHDILLICSKYDKFMLEEDGRIDEQIFQEYVSINLRYPPIFTQVSNQEEAFEQLKEKEFDLIISMVNLGDILPFELSEKIKDAYPEIPIVVLTHFSREVSNFLANKDLSHIDYVFSWLGDSSILLAIVKLIEDSMNVEHDVRDVGTYAIILVENSIRYYSSYLPNMYKILFNQTHSLMKEGLNEHQKTMRMRARPKILLANNYEQAMDMYEKYKENILGIISDISYSKDGKNDSEAGLKLCRFIRSENQDIPILLQSSQSKHKEESESMNAAFINKNSKKLLNELRKYIRTNFGFGDFIFIDPDTGSEIGRAVDLKSLQHKLEIISLNSFEYHAYNNHFSKWFKARSLFTLADLVKNKKKNDFKSTEDTRNFMINIIKSYRINAGRGTIATFDKDHFDNYTGFARIGKGSLGGKGRGLAFIDSFLKRNNMIFKYDNLTISVPKTIIISTDVFEDFMELNDLYGVALSDYSDEKILKYFLDGDMPPYLKETLKCILSYLRKPLAIRSSSLLEDSYFQPFAGVYSTYMISNNNSNINIRIKELCQAIKSVFASTFFKFSKNYMAATCNVVDEEKMSVIIQEISGEKFTNADNIVRFYPSLSGVARSLNFYPVGKERSDEGVVNIALGLGKTIVDGNTSLRFSPKYPKKILQLSNAEMALRNTQKKFYALDMDKKFIPSVNESDNLVHLDLDEAVNDNSIKMTSSTYDAQNGVLRDGNQDIGKKVMTFAPILKYGMIPLAEVLKDILELGSEEMNTPVEIEFAMKISTDKDIPHQFHFLQIRPIVQGLEYSDIIISDEETKRASIISTSALGNGIIDDITDIVYIRSEDFNPANTEKIAVELEKINDKFVKENKHFVLIGPGRWGSSDPWLGIPVKWAQISHAKVIIEHGLKDFHIDPSQGSHFFQNITLLKVIYMTINPYLNDGKIDMEKLNNINSVYENNLLRHVKLDKNLFLKANGATSEAVIIL